MGLRLVLCPLPLPPAVVCGVLGSALCLGSGLRGQWPVQGLLCSLLRFVAGAHVTRDSSSRACAQLPTATLRLGLEIPPSCPLTPAAGRLDAHSPQRPRVPEGRALAPCSSESHWAGRGSVPPSWAQPLCRTHWAARSRAFCCRERVKNDRDSQELVAQGWEGHAGCGGAPLSSLPSPIGKGLWLGRPST